jgi:ribosome-associated protein
MEADIYVSDELTIRANEIEIATSRSGGPGGQHVQKTDSRVTLRWNIATSRSLDEGVRARLLRKLAFKLTGEGEIILHVDSERSQIRNREIAKARLAAIILNALHIPKARHKTRPSLAAKARRIDEKKRVSTVKKSRSSRAMDD